MSLLPKRIATVSCAVVALAAAGCGGSDVTDAPAAAKPAPAVEQPFVDLTQAEAALERGDVELVRTGRGDAIAADDVEPRPLESARYETGTSREFDLIVFPTTAAARRAWPSAVDAAGPGERGSAVRALNVVAVFPEPFTKVDAYRAVARALRGLAVGEPDAANPKSDGEGVGDEAARIGATIVVGDLGYSAQIARQLNPRIKPDEELVGGRLPGADKTWFGVFVRVCNRTDEPLRATGRLALVDAFGERVEPVDLPASNPFAYEPGLVGPGECLPPSGSVSDRVTEGALVLFEVTDEFLAERPVALEVSGTRGERHRVELDL